MSTTTTTGSPSEITATMLSQGRVRRKLNILTADGTLLSVDDWSAQGYERTVVFLHGLCLTRKAWSVQARELLRRSGTETRVVSYDHRGHGASGSAARTSYHVGQLAADIDHVLAELRVRGPVILVGHSMGAMTALEYVTGADRSFDVAGLVLCATAAGHLAAQGIGRLLEIPAAVAVADALARCPDRAGGALAAPLRLALDRVATAGRGRNAALAGVFAEALETNPLSTAVGFLTSLRDFDRTPQLPGITARTTILSGGTDMLTPPSLSREMEASIPGATHIHIPTAGHMLPQEEPRTVSAAILTTVQEAAPVDRSRRFLLRVPVA